MSLADEVAKLAKLKEQGLLSDEEFAQSKALLLSDATPADLPEAGTHETRPPAVRHQPTEPGRTRPGPPPMPIVDKWLWFAAIPAIWFGLAAAIPAAYEHPLPYLADLLLIGAVVSWILRRPYFGWARTFRIAVTVVAALVVVTTAAQQTESLQALGPGSGRGFRPPAHDHCASEVSPTSYVEVHCHGSDAAYWRVGRYRLDPERYPTSHDPDEFTCGLNYRTETREGSDVLVECWQLIRS